MGKNIVFIGPAPFPNGFASTKRWSNMIQYFNDNSIHNKLLITKHSYFQKFKNPSKGKINYTEFEDFTPYWNNARSLIKYYDAIFKKLKIYFEINKTNYLIFPSFITPSFYPMMLYAKKIGYKIIFDKMEDISIIKDGSLKSKIKFVIIKIMDSIVVKKAAGVIVISSFLYNDYSKKVKNIILLPNSINNLYIKNEYISKSNTEILFSGSFDEKNGPHLLIEAVIKLNSTGVKAILNITGIQSGKYYEDCYRKFSNYNFIKFLGFVSEEDLRNLLINSDILAITRTNTKAANYGFPYKLSEYLATGKPVICSNIGDVCLYVTHMKSAYIINSDSIEEIFEGLKYLIQNPKDAVNIGTQGKLISEKFFNINTNGKTFVEFLNIL